MNATGVLAQLITKNVSDTSKSVLRSFHTIIASPTLNTKDNKDFMKARSQRVGLPAIRNIRFGDKLISRFEHCSTRKNFIVTEEKRDTVLRRSRNSSLASKRDSRLKLPLYPFPEGISNSVLSYNVRRNELHALLGKRCRSFPRSSSMVTLSRTRDNVTMVPRFYDSFNRFIDQMK